MAKSWGNIFLIFNLKFKLTLFWNILAAFINGSICEQKLKNEMKRCEEKPPAEDITSIWAIISNLKLDQVLMKYISNLKTEEWDESMWRKSTCSRWGNWPRHSLPTANGWSSPEFFLVKTIKQCLVKTQTNLKLCFLNF